jgi:hypothetical protein
VGENREQKVIQGSENNEVKGKRERKKKRKKSLRKVKERREGRN